MHANKVSVECTVCHKGYECTNRDWRTELRNREWRIDLGCITCKDCSPLHWPTRSRVLAVST